MKSVIVLLVLVMLIGCTEREIRQRCLEFEVNYVPVTLDEAIEYWTCALSEDSVAIFKELDEEKIHYWSNSRMESHMKHNWRIMDSTATLNKYFTSLGVTHYSDMQGLIVTSLFRTLNGREIELNRQVDRYAQFWSVMKVPEKSDYPSEILNPELGIRVLRYKDDSDKWGCIHFHQDTLNNEIWIHDYSFGWREIDKSTLADLEESKDGRLGLMREIYDEKTSANNE